MTECPCGGTWGPVDRAPAILPDESTCRTCGERGPRWPDVIWARFQEESRLQQEREEKANATRPRFSVVTSEEMPHSHRWWISVHCPVCAVGGTHEDDSTWRHRNGCILCAPLHERLNAVVHAPAWRTWRRSLCGNRSVAPIAADWLEEEGLPEVAEILRQDWAKELERRYS